VSGIALPAGSTPWLLVHELKLSLRAVTGRKGGLRGLIIVGVALVLGTIFGGIPVAKMLGHAALQPSAPLMMGFDAALLLIFTLMLSQTLASATTAFFERGDLDLLLSSPLPARRVLAVRAVAIATTPFLWFTLFLTPVLLPVAVMGQPRFLAAYLMLAAVALLAGAAGVSLAMALFRLLGARRTRTVGQLIAALIGAGFFLISQSRNFLPDNGREAFGGVMRWAASGVFAPAAPLSWPARGVMGQPLPLLAFMAGALLIFAAMAAGLGRRFSVDASMAAGVGSGPVRVSNRAVTTKGFGGGVFSTMIRKELRLLVRDPTLLSQVLLRTLYVLPMTFVLVKSAGHHSTASNAPAYLGAFGLAPYAGALTFMAGQIAGSLAWITISAEDAPELLACAPVDSRVVRRAKLAATMIPVALLLAAPVIALLVIMPWVGVCALAGAAVSAMASGRVNLWFEKPAPRKAFRSRRGGSATGAIAELGLGLGWGVSAGMAAALSPWALIPMAATAVAMGVLYGLANPDRAY